MTQLSIVSTSTKKPSAAARIEALKLPVARMADRIAAKEAARKLGVRQAGARLSKADRRRAKLQARTPVTARDTHVEPIGQMVDDPYEPGGKLEVQVNRRTDVLKEERSHGRISEAAFLTGREIQGILEHPLRAQLPPRSWMGGTERTGNAQSDAMVRAVELAQRAETEMTRLKASVGEIGARFLREIIAEGTSFADYAARRGWSGERKVAYVADRFRWFLEDLAEFRAARGPGQAPMRAERAE